jgi:hypothetical protein
MLTYFLFLSSVVCNPFTLISLNPSFGQYLRQIYPPDFVSVRYFRFHCTNIPIIIYYSNFDVLLQHLLSLFVGVIFTYHNIIHQAGCEHLRPCGILLVFSNE